MKNKKLLFLSVVALLMTSCGGSHSSINGSSLSSINDASSSHEELSNSQSKEYSLTDELLAKLKVGYSFEAKVSEKSSSDTTSKNYVHNIAWLNDSYSIKVLDESEAKINLFETYSKREDDFIYSERLNVNNEKTYFKVYNPVGQEYYKVTDGYFNVFSNLSINSFKKIDSSVYELNLEDVNLKDSFSAIATQLYGNPGFTLTKFEMTLGEDGIDSISASAISSGKTNVYTYNYEISDIKIGEETVFFERAQAFDDEGYAELDQGISTIKEHNFTCDFSSTDGTVEKASGTLISNEKGVYYLIEDEEDIYSYGFLYTDDGVVEVEENSDGKFEVVGTYPDFDVYEETLPSFAINSKCFTFEDGLYKMKNGVEDDADVFFNTQPLVDELSDFSILVDDDSVYMANKHGVKVDDAMFYNFGESELPFSEESLLESVGAQNWEEVLGEYYDPLVEKYGELMLALPLVDGHNGKESWINFSEEPEYDMLVSTVEEADVDANIESYCSLLDDAGFEKQEEAGENGGIVYFGYPEVNGVELTVYIELVNYEGLFTILLMVTE